MSIFFKALEQAEREHAQRRGGIRSDGLDEAPSFAPSSLDVDEATALSRDRTAVVDPPVTSDYGPTRPSELAAADADEAGGAVDEHLVSLIRPNSPEAEQYRALRHAIHRLHAADGISVIAISSPTSGDGKTTTAINTAAALSQSPEARVLLMDLDLRNGSVAGRLGGREWRGAGVVDVITRTELTLSDVVRRCEPYNLFVVPAGATPTRPHEIVESPRLADLIEQARHQYDYVVLDMPPIVPVLDGRVISRWVDGFLLVVAAHRTPRRLLEDALNVMDPSKVMGLVFNHEDNLPLGYYR